MTTRRIKRLWLDARPGMKDPRAKLTDDDVRAIRAAYAALPMMANGRGRADVGKLAAYFGVSRSLVTRVARGTAWRHLSF